MEKRAIRKAVMAVIINNEGKVLIGSSPRDGGFKFPQGGLDPGEAIIDGVKRELFEELGIQITDGDISFISKNKVSYQYPEHDPYYIYLAQELAVVKIKFKTTWRLIPQDDEFEELVWIKPSELANYNTNFRYDAYQEALKICGLV